MLLLSFNTTLVQLKVVGIEPGDLVSIHGFNTTLVQLKETPPRRAPGARLRFQYHTGSIKRSQFKTILHKYTLYFNTTLVQLKDSQPYRSRKRANNFNTTLVQLKDEASSRLATKILEISIPHWFN
jgi:hypothetical protein